MLNSNKLIKLQNLIIFFVLSLLCSFNIFSKENPVISPVGGEWSNYQSLVLDLDVGETAYYSFTGENPLNSGFAYDAPVFLELDGNVTLKIAIVNKENSIREYIVSYKVIRKGLNELFFLDHSKDAVIIINENQPLQISNNVLFSLNDDLDPYLNGKSLTISKYNEYEHFIPLKIQQENDIYRFVLDVKPVVQLQENKEDEIISNVVSNDAEEKIYSLRDCPFTIKFIDWTKMKISTADKMYVCLDGGNWSTGFVEYDLQRDVEHVLLWLDTSNVQIDNFDIEALSVYKCIIPKQPNLELSYEVKDGKHKVNKIQLSDANYKLKINSLEKSSVCIDTLEGNNFSKDVSFLVTYDGFDQGNLTKKVIIDKEPPVNPIFTSSVEGFYVRAPVKLTILSDDTVYYNVAKLVIKDFNESLELSNKNNVLTDIDSLKYVECASKEIFLNDDTKDAVCYNINVYAEDKESNVSDVVTYQVIIDKYNYYVNDKITNAEYIPDGSPTRPFSSINNLNSLLMTPGYKKVFIEGNFSGIDKLQIKSDCEIVSKNKSRVSFSKNGMIEIINGKASFENIIFEQDDNSNNVELLQQNLFKLNNASLTLNECELLSVYNKNGSIIFADKSDIQIINSRLTVQANDYASAIILLNSKLKCSLSQISVIAKNANGFSLDVCSCDISKCAVQIVAPIVSFFELNKSQFSISENEFKTNSSKSSEELYSIDMFSKKILFDKNSYLGL